MKCLLLLAFVGGAQAAAAPCPSDFVWGSTAVATESRIISTATNTATATGVVTFQLNEGYLVNFLAADGTAAAADFVDGGDWVLGTVFNVFNIDPRTDDGQFVVTCDAANGYVPSNVAGVSDATTPRGFGATCPSSGGAWTAGTNLATGITTTAWVAGTFLPSDWICRKARAQISCTSAASNGLVANAMCTSLPAWIWTGHSVLPCGPAAAPLTAATDGGAATAFNARGWLFTVAAAPTIDTVVAFVCSARLFDIPSSAILNLALPWYSAYNTGNNNACNCATGTTITFDYSIFTLDTALSPVSYTQCLATCNAAALPVAVVGPGTTRQAFNGRTVSGCSNTLDTLWEVTECLRRANCQGAINTWTDICVISTGMVAPVGVNGAGAANPPTTAACSTGTAATAVAMLNCPKCHTSKSKKGLLALLGLIGIVPLLLCLLCSSLLFCLLFLLCCIRKKKTERDVHFATFDAGAPPQCEPMAMPMPMTQTMHCDVPVHHTTHATHTHVGAPHMGMGAPVAY